MKFIISISIVILTTSLFSGCEVDNNSTKYLPNLENKQLPHINKKIQNNLVGTWVGKCHYEEFNDESYQAELTFNQDLSFYYTEKTYPTQACTGDYYSEVNTENGNYNIGQITKGKDGLKAYEFETHTLENNNINDEYFMVRVTHSTLIFTDENVNNSQPTGETPQTRNNYFNEIPRILFTKKP